MVRLSVAAALVLVATPVGAEVGPESDGTTPENPRDFSGLWMNDNSLDEQLKRQGLRRLDPNAPPPPPPPPPPLTEEYRAIQVDREAARAHLDVGVQACEWPGMPRIMTYPYPFEILHTPGRVTMIFEADSQVRRIFLNRDEHLPFDELDPTYNGDSIGRWDGDTLVIDTVGFHEHTELAPGVPHSAELRIEERIRYIDGDTIELRMVMTDPLALTEAIERTVIYSKRPDWRIREYSCLENNRDAPDAEGNRVGGVVGK